MAAFPRYPRSLTAMMRFWAICLFASAGLCHGPAAFSQPANENNTLSVNSAALELNPGLPEDTRLGALRYLGGLILASDDSRFGGYSGLSVDADGGGAWAVSDRGHWLRMEFALRPDGVPGMVRIAALRPLLGPDGRVLEGRQSTDAEGLRRDESGAAWVSFERRHRLLYYPGGPEGRAPPLEIPLPGDIARLPGNGGLESVVLLGANNGQAADLLLLAEQPLPGEAGFAPLWLRRAGEWTRLSWPLTGDFRPTDAVKLPGNRRNILVLERDFRWLAGWAVRLSRVSGQAIEAGGVLQPERLAEWMRPYANDNLEAMDVRIGPDGAPWLYLMSDDNHSRSQRTLLLIFRLEP